MSKTGRNDPCPCGSGKKYKKCCAKNSGKPAPSAGGNSLPFLNPSLLAQQWLASKQTDDTPSKLYLDHFEYTEEKTLAAVKALGKLEGESVIFYEKKQWMGEVAVSIPGQLLLTTADRGQADKWSEVLRSMDDVTFVSRTEDKYQPLAAEDKAQMAVEMLDFKTRFFQAWLDEPNQRLDGMTPRQAVADDGQKGHLKALIKELEAKEAKLPKKERYSFQAIKKTLGL